MTAIPIRIGSETFNSITAAKSRCSELLDTRNFKNLDEPITDSNDVALLEALFHSRPEKVAMLGGRSIIGWGRELNNDNMSFAALLDNGTRLHFSFHKSVDALAASQR